MRFTFPQNFRYRGWRESDKILTFESAFLQEITEINKDLSTVRSEIDSQYEAYSNETVQVSGDAIYSELAYLIRALRRT